MKNFYTNNFKKNIIKCIIYIILSSIITSFFIIYSSKLTVPDVYGDKYRETYAIVINSEKVAKVRRWMNRRQREETALDIGYNLTIAYDVEGIVYKNTLFLQENVSKVKIYYNVFNPKDIILEDDMQIRGLLIVIKYLAGLLNIGFILRLLDMLFWHQENYL